MRRGAGRRRLTRVLALLLGGVVLLLAWGAWAGLAARADLLAAREQLERLAASNDPGQAGPALRSARARADRAVDRLGAPGPAALAAVPVLGRSWAAGQAAAQASAALLGTAERALPVLDALGTGDGRVSLPAVAELAAVLEAGSREVDAAVDRLGRVPRTAVPPPVRGGLDEAEPALVAAADALRRSGPGARAVHGLLGGSGPRTLLVGVMNNAELRGAGGYVSSYTVVSAADGVLQVAPFTDVNDVQVPAAQAVRVPAPPAYAKRYGRYLADTTLWKNVAMSSHQPATAQVMCSVARSRPGVPCDAAVLLDVPALADLIELAGPVDLGGEQVSGDDLVEALLVEAYADADQQSGDQAERRTRLLAAADAALPRLLGARVDVSTLRVLADAAAGRHLALWSERPQEQADLTAAGLSGSVDPGSSDVLLVAANQVSNSKLDYYVRRELALDVEVGTDTAQVRQSVELSLDHPDGLPEYVLGPRGRLDELVELALPDRARAPSLTVDGVPQRFELDTDVHGSGRVTDLVQLNDGDRVELVLEYELPLEAGNYRALLLPQPLARPAGLRLDVRAAPGLRLVPPLVEGGVLETTRRLDVRVERPPWWSRRVVVPW